MRDGFRVIDCDGHMVEPLDIWERYVEPAYRDRAPKVIGTAGRLVHELGPCEPFPEGRPVIYNDGVTAEMARYGEAYDSWWSLPTRLKHMDEEGIDVMVTFPTNGFHATWEVTKNADLQAALCRAYNNWATDFCTDSEGRVKFVAQVTRLDAAEAVKEIERLAGRREVAAVLLPISESGQLLADPTLDAIWTALSEADFPVCFHGGASLPTLFKEWMAGSLPATTHAIGFPFEVMVALGALVEGGVLERFPNLRAGFFEGNAGWVPWWLGRLDDHMIGRQSIFLESGNLSLSPSEYFQRQCFVSADVDEAHLQPVVALLDGKNILFNTDYPHSDAKFPGAVDTFLDHPVSNDAKGTILWDNALQFFGRRFDDIAPVGE